MKEEQGSSRGQHKNLQQGKQEQQQKRGKDRGWGRGRGQPGGSLCPERPCVSGLLLMTLSWVGSPTAAPGRKQSWMWMSLLRAPLVKNPPANSGNRRDLALIPGSGRPPRGGNGNSLQYSFLENPMDRGAWWAAVHGVTQSQTELSYLAWAHTHTSSLFGKAEESWKLKQRLIFMFSFQITDLVVEEGLWFFLLVCF